MVEQAKLQKNQKVETRNHFKNGATLKSQMSRNFIIKNMMKKILMSAAFIGLIFVCSCSKDEKAGGGGISVYYVLEGLYGNNPQNPRTGTVLEIISDMTMPSGSNQHGLLMTPYTSVARDYTSGTTVTLRGESMLTYTTITVKLYKDGVLWKSNTTTATGAGNYAVATVTGTL
jgi:hypothetical protein